MKWMKERDLLIAQTMAFVQSVKGKRPDAEMMRPAPQPALPPETPTETPVETSTHVIETRETQLREILTQAAGAPARPVPTVFEIPPDVVPAQAAAATVAETPAAIASATPDQLPHFAKLDIRGDFGSEVRARVADFRANQQRFLREREEYCSSTMAKVRAAIRDNSELPRSGK
ncbi:hypothetical protein AS156_12460 [Bradyrhizobium macuxiense]|uniref:Uncharacterized protein n=1 Tax=Bradyrhizobium macuxiense TaxID=1755647 RepID=A0A120FKY8_9BRAD|nr:hypothetical protein [Bradyrhizobium macuxiense]KWV51392.1 hypothetical protein AS156_12460 [Bradyrhizobium macuxiense]